ncbi:hypothetical protein [Thermoflavimicrobium dichotomicum]|uniref:Lipoprotein n=1 Tax=Thermoflavimicrobium dichotomicum TaxID=46223 RepID=A0A1I3TEG0_9BACL|nr:hypothetical protein [Thermoflavimicrobium dichotomicum]SFJ68892.1 hypothetical protein SAMN05421852_11717 [Thermoflavimicrobium dichotomicum]
MKIWGTFMVCCLCILTLMGCNPEIPKYPKPPLPTITADGKKVSAVRGSYCWKSGNKGECVDAIESTELVKNHQPIPVLPQTKLLIHFDYPPKGGTLKAEQWSNGKTWADGKVKPIPIQNQSMILPHEKGKYIYHIYGNWKEGSASYFFVIEVR